MTINDSQTVLVVDDVASIREGLTRVLQRLGYRVLAAPGGAEAIDLLQHRSVDILLLDLEMPDLSGDEVVTDALTVAPDVGIIMLSGRNDAFSAATCMQRGALDYLTKPVDMETLERAIRRAMLKRDTQRQTEEFTSWLRSEVEARTRELQQEQDRLMDVALATLGALATALEARDPCFAGHSARVASVAATIAADMALSDDDVEDIRTAGRVHDLGMISVRDGVLTKPGPLDPDEVEHVRQHVVIGAQLLEPWPLGDVAAVVRHHHERWDGTGYPDGLAGEDIPIGARIVGAVEIYDALTSARSYQQQRTPDEAVRTMKAWAKGTVDPAVMEALEAVVAKRQTLLFLNDSR